MTIPGSKGDQKRQQILQAIHQLTLLQHAYPTVAEIQVFVGIRSFDTVTRHLKILEREGLVEWASEYPKTVKVMNETKQA